MKPAKKKKLAQGKTAKRIQTTRTVTDTPSISVATEKTEIEIQAAEYRAMVARAAMIGIKKGESTPLALFEEVWKNYFYGPPRPERGNDNIILHKS